VVCLVCCVSGLIDSNDWLQSGEYYCTVFSVRRRWNCLARSLKALSRTSSSAYLSCFWSRSPTRGLTTKDCDDWRPRTRNDRRWKRRSVTYAYDVGLWCHNFLRSRCSSSVKLMALYSSNYLCRPNVFLSCCCDVKISLCMKMTWSLCHICGCSVWKVWFSFYERTTCRAQTRFTLVYRSLSVGP